MNKNPKDLKNSILPEPKIVDTKDFEEAKEIIKTLGYKNIHSSEVVKLLYQKLELQLCFNYSLLNRDMLALIKQYDISTVKLVLSQYHEMKISQEVNKKIFDPLANTTVSILKILPPHLPLGEEITVNAEKTLKEHDEKVKKNLELDKSVDRYKQWISEFFRSLKEAMDTAKQYADGISEQLKYKLNKFIKRRKKVLFLIKFMLLLIALVFFTAENYLGKAGEGKFPQYLLWVQGLVFVVSVFFFHPLSESLSDLILKKDAQKVIDEMYANYIENELALVEYCREFKLEYTEIRSKVKEVFALEELVRKTEL